MKPSLYIPPTSTLTSHGPSTTAANTTIYEPSEDSFLLIDAISSDTEREFLHSRFSPGKQGRATQVSAAQSSPTPLVFEVGVGSGVVLGYVSAYAEWILGRKDVICAGGDVNHGAVQVGRWNVGVAGRERGWIVVKGESDSCVEGNSVGGESFERKGGRGKSGYAVVEGKGNGESSAVIDEDGRGIANANTHGNGTGTGQALFLDILHSSLLTALAPKNADILLFNPPYVPTETLPSPNQARIAQSNFEIESHLYALAYAGGQDGMEVTNQLLAQLDDCLSDRGVAYVLFCARNWPEEVMRRLEREGWGVAVAGKSGGKGGWERLCVLRVFRKEGMG